MLAKWQSRLGISDKWAAYHDEDTELDENPLLGNGAAQHDDQSNEELQTMHSGNDQKSSWTTIDSLSHTFIPSLEGLRGIAVSLTIFCHCATGPRDMRDASGSAGVTIFFVLSGFLITGVLIRLKVRLLVIRGGSLMLTFISHSTTRQTATPTFYASI